MSFLAKRRRLCARASARFLELALVSAPSAGAVEIAQWTGASDAARGLLDRAASHPEIERLYFEVPAALVRDFVGFSRTNTAQDETAAPVNAICSRWEASVRPSTNTTSVRVEMTGTILQATTAQPVNVRLLPLTAVFSDLRLNGEPFSPLRWQCFFTAPFTAPGDFKVAATLAVTPDVYGPEQRLRLVQPGFTIGTVRIDSDEAWEVWLTGRPGRVTGAAGAGTHGVLAAGRGQSLVLVWRPPQADRVRQGTVSVRPSMAWTVGDAVVSANGVLDVATVGGVSQRVGLRLPEQADRVQASGPDVKHFRHTDSGLDVEFRGPLAGRTTVRLSFEVPRGKGNLLTCSDIVVRGGRLDAGGWVLIAHDGAGELLEQSAKGLDRCATVEVPANVLGLLPGKPLFAYRRAGHRAQCVLDHFATQPFPLVDTIADRADVTALLRPDGEEMVRVRYAMRNHRRQFLRVTLPANARLLWLAVEGRTTRPTRDGAQLLVPLVKSVQTLEGLVAFPVELVYCRKDKPLAGRSRHTVDLPEIADAPVANVRAEVYVPQGLEVRGTDGALSLVKTFTTGQGSAYGQGHTGPAGARPAQDVPRTLARNYYEAGYRAYRQGRLEEAEELFRNVTEAQPDALEADEVRSLLRNIRAGRGEEEGREREEKARVARVQKELQADNTVLEARQQALVDDAEKMIQGGDEEYGARFLEEAVAVGRKLVQRGAGRQEQQSVLGRFQNKLAELRNREREHAELKQRLRTARAKVSGMALSATNAAEPAVSAQRLTAALSDTAAAAQISIGDVQEAAFGVTPQQQETSADVDSRVQALTFQKRDASQPVAGLPPSASRAGRSLAAENALLRLKVFALERAVEKVQKEPEPASPSAVSDQTAVEARRQIQKARENLDGILRDADPARASAEAVDEQALRSRLGQLRAMANAYANTYGALDPRLGDEVRGLRDRISSGERQVDAFLEERRKARHVALDLSGVVRADSASDQNALVNFLAANYRRQVQDNVVQFEAGDGQLTVLNRDDNAAVLGEAVERLRRNSGLAVPVTGVSVRTPRVADLPVIGRLFTQSTGDGHPLAVLDEPQCRTLLAAGSGTVAAEQRSVIVGTANRVAGEMFRLTRGGADYNTLDVRGAEVRVAANRYLAVDHGTHVSLLRAGRAAPWFQTAPAAGARVALFAGAAAPELPVVGQALFFEKTLLAAGESPDIVLAYENEGRR